MMSIGRTSSSILSRRLGSTVARRSRTTQAVQQQDKKQQHLVTPQGLYIERLAHEEGHAKTSEEQSVSGGPSSEEIAMPRKGFHAPVEQAPGRDVTWSQTQNPRANANRGPRFEQTSYQFQPQPLPAIELIAQEPIRLVNERIAVCDGGGGPLGHPKIYINLDKPGARACGYCGIRFERDHSDHDH